MVSSTNYTIYAAEQIVALSTYTQSPACSIIATEEITYSET